MEHELVDAFLEDGRRKGKAADTLAQYRSAVTELGRHLPGHTAGNPSFFAATADTATRYTEALRRSGCTAKIRQRKLHAVYAFYEWLRQSGHLLLNPFPRPGCEPQNQLPRRLPSMETLRAAYHALRESPHLWEQRDFVLIDLAYACGLRRCELHRLDLDDINLDDGLLRLRGKAGNERLVPMGPRTRADLRRYLAHIRPCFITAGAPSALFLSNHAGGKRLALHSINAIFARLRRTHSLARSFAPHALRHAFATHLLRGGAAIRDVSEMLGHVKLETTRLYTHLAPSDLRRHHAHHHPRP
jgi:site-specific recombinase XerD